MMKKNMFRMVFAVGLLMWVGQAHAQSMSYSTPIDWSFSPWEVSIQGGAAIPDRNNSDSGSNFAGRITYDINTNVAVGFTANWINYDFKANQDTGEVNFGDIHGYPMLATIVYKMPIESMGNRVVPYLVGGLGLIFWSFNENEGIDAGDDHTFAAQAGAGVDWYFTDRLALFGEATYLFSDDLETGTRVAGVSGNINQNVNNILIGGGLKAKF